ncbi:MAG: methylmalonyl-CoA mutase family protein [Hyphomicrobiaceae bacterium]
MSHRSYDSSSSCDIALAESFLPVSRETWLKAVEKALKGAAFEDRLMSRTFDDIAIQPLYEQAKTAKPQPWSRSAAPWQTYQRLDHPDPAAANALALNDLENGSNGLTIVKPDPSCRNGYGLIADNVSALDAALSEIALDMVDLRIDQWCHGEQYTALLAALVQHREINPNDLNIHFGLDPLGDLMRAGELKHPWFDIESRLMDTVVWLKSAGYSAPFMCCDVRIVHEAGGSEAQELGVALAMGVSYLRAFERKGLDGETASRALSWSFAADADQFLTVAKLRAMRELWGRVQEVSHLPARPIHIHAETSWRMMSQLDAAVNMLRSTVATAAAGIGGADSLSVLPHTLPLGLPDSAARRIARNLQIILLEESNLWRVCDPAAGSGAYEALTQELCDVAWRLFQEIEGEGGLVESLIAGRLQRRIAEVCKARRRRIGSRELPLIGTSSFPNLSEAPPTVLDIPKPGDVLGAMTPLKLKGTSFADHVSALAEGRSLRDISTSPGSSTLQVYALPSVRLSEPFEILRATADEARQQTGLRPSVFVATLGTLAEYGERAMWTENLLAIAGIEAVRSEGASESGAVGRVFATSGCHVACICGADDAYHLLADATVQALKTAAASHVYIVGRPGAQEGSLRSSGVDGFLYDGIDVISTLQMLQCNLGIDKPRP